MSANISKPKLREKLDSLFVALSGITQELATFAAITVTGAVSSATATITGLLTAGSLKLGGTTVTSTAAELNYVDVTTIGTAQASKAVVLDANKDIAGLNAVGAASLGLSGNATISGTLGMSDVLTTAGVILTTKTASVASGNWTLSAAEMKATYIVPTGASGASRDVIATPTAGKLYIVTNSSNNDAVFKATGQTGVTVATTKSAVVIGNGTDFVRVTLDA